MAKHQRTRADLEQELREQAAALRASSASYDAGTLWEAKRIASTAYILLHDGGRNSKSLLGQLDLKGPMLSSANHSPDAVMPLANITIEFGQGHKGPTFVPVLANYFAGQMLPFSTWYEESVFINGHLSLSRKNLIFTFRSQAGGAHVDPNINDDAFQWLRTNSPIRMKTEPGPLPLDGMGHAIKLPPELENAFPDFDGPVPNAHFASMRQIGWEIDQKLISAGY